METKVRLNDIDKRVIERVANIINEEPGIDEDNWIEVEDLLSILDSLEDSYNDLKYEYEEYKEKVRDNYKPIGEGDNYRFYANTIQKLDEECNKQYRFIVKKGLKDQYDEYTE